MTLSQSILLIAALLLPLTLSAIPQHELEALHDLYTSTNGPSWLLNTNWLSGCPCANSWYGLLCDSTNTHVTGLLFTANNLVGQIPDSIGNLTELFAITFNGNNLFGTIPSSMTALTKLFALGMTFNHLTGPLPTDIGSWTQMQFLHLDFNYLSGSIPASFSNMKNLKYLGLYGNRLNGTVDLSSLLSSMHQLEMVFLDWNLLSGSLNPVVLPSSGTVQILGLKGNQLSGPFNLEGNTSGLKEVQIQDISDIGGSLPLSLSAASDLIFLTASKCGLGGTLDSYSCFGDFKQLTILDLSQNEFTGTIPEWVKKLVNHKIMLGQNPFHCPIPQWAKWTEATCQTQAEHQMIESKKNEDESFQFSWKTSTISEKVGVEIFGMAKCPDMKSIEHVFSSLRSTCPSLDNLISLHLNFIGSVQESEPTGIYTMHGQTEGLGELFEICVMDYYFDGTEFNWDGIFQFIECMNSNQANIPSDADKCALGQNIPFVPLLECALGSKARTQLQESVRRAEKFGAVWSPTVYMDGKLICMWDSEPCLVKDPQGFIEQICEMYQGSFKSPCCQS